MDNDDFNELEPIELAIDGELDLHHFSPKDIKTLIPDYLTECIHLGIKEVRIIHGKGKGHLRRSTHAILDRCELVVSYRTGGMQEGSWGATIVQLKGTLKNRDL